MDAQMHTQTLGCYVLMEKQGPPEIRGAIDCLLRTYWEKFDSRKKTALGLNTNIFLKITLKLTYLLFN